jgi:hypothetical protein
MIKPPLQAALSEVARRWHVCTYQGIRLATSHAGGMPFGFPKVQSGSGLVISALRSIG